MTANAAPWSPYELNHRQIRAGAQGLVGASLDGTLLVAPDGTTIPSSVSGGGKNPKTSHATVVRITPGTGPAYVTALTIAAGAKKSFDIQIPCPGPEYVAARPIFANYNATPLTIGLAKVASAPKHLASTGTQLGVWPQLAFSGSSTGAIAGRTTNGVQDIPGILIADLVLITSVARDDAGTRRMLRVRTLIDNSASGSPLNFNALNAPAAMATWNADPTNNGFQIGAYTSVSADLVTTTADSTAVVDTGATMVCIGAIFYTSAAIASGAAVGDSLVGGIGSSAGGVTNGFKGWVTQLTALDIGISIANWACPSQTTQDTRSTLIAILAAHKPDYMFFKSWSPNDGNSQANFDTAWFYTLDMIEQCRQAGVTPVVLTSSPLNAYDATQNARRVAQNARTLALAGPGLIVADTGAAVADPANPSQILAAAAATVPDGLHLGDYGYQLQRDVVRRAIGF